MNIPVETDRFKRLKIEAYSHAAVGLDTLVGA